MPEPEPLVERILKKMKERPIEWSITLMAEELNKSQSAVSPVMTTLAYTNKIVPTRKSGKAQLYVIKGEEHKYKKEN